MRILLVEDDELLGDGLQVGLRQTGYQVDWLRDGLQARAALATEDYAAVVLDLGLPRLDGVTLLREVRTSGNKTPVLVLTARDSTLDKIKGLDSGADDYLIKPVDLAELAARLRALLRRAHGVASPKIRCGAVEWDPATRQAHLHDTVVDLSAKEGAVLEMLMRHPGRIVSRSQLESALYGWDGGVESNAVEVHMHHLRRKLGADRIKTLRGLGYRFEEID